MNLRAAVLELFGRRPTAWLSRNQVAGELELSPKERRGLEAALDALVRSGHIELVHRKYRISRAGGTVAGEFHATRGGFGFVTPETGHYAGDLFVPARDTLGAFEGDRVAVTVKTRAPGASPEAKVVKILTRSERAVVGIIQGGFLLPTGAGMSPVALPDRSLADGQMACVRLEPGDGPPRARRVEALGALDDPQTPIRAAEVRFGLSRSFPAEVEAEASSFGAHPAPSDLEGRTDFRSLATLTIDPEDAKDFDDALSVRPEGHAFRLWVHIADVSHYVRPGTALDREAARRGNSVYLPGTVYPMLPHGLSSSLCSLVPGEDRLVFTVEMVVDAKGRVREVHYHRGVIRSAARLSYGRAQAILEGAEAAPPEVAELLKNALALQRLLFARRLSLGTLDLDLPEADLRFGLTGKVEEVLPTVRFDSHRIVEEAMLAANETVAREMARRESPSLYRVHEDPNAEKLEALRPLLNALGLGAVSRGDMTNPFTLQKLLEATEGHPAAKLVAYLVLRAMSQARYSDVLGKHYGLGFEAYTHFTSPIRRYPDLVVHRALAAALAGETSALGDLHEVAAQCSRTERVADLAEREVLSWYQMAFLAGRLGETFDAMVLGFTKFGARVELTDHLIDGMCPFHAVSDDYITVSGDSLSAKGQRSGAVLRVGDLIRVTLVRVDRLAGEAQFVPEGWGEGSSRPPARPRRTRK
jgi:ribonuclease R